MDFQKGKIDPMVSQFFSNQVSAFWANMGVESTEDPLLQSSKTFSEYR